MTQTTHNSTLSYYRCYIQPGQIAYSYDPSLICAVCGNGVLVMIRDRMKRVGGVAHCIYPKRVFWDKPTNYHADIAIASLVNRLKGCHLVSRYWEAQLFGGGNYHGYEEKRAEKVLKRVRNVLKKYAIRIVSEDVGGAMGRKVIFNTLSGEVIVHKTRKIRKTDWTPERQRPQKILW